MVLKLYLVSCFCLIRLGEIMLQNTMKTSEWGLHILFISLLHLYIQYSSSAAADVCLSSPFLFQTRTFMHSAFCIKKSNPSVTRSTAVNMRDNAAWVQSASIVHTFSSWLQQIAEVAQTFCEFLCFLNSFVTFLFVFFNIVEWTIQQVFSAFSWSNEEGKVEFPPIMIIQVSVLTKC